MYKEVLQSIKGIDVFAAVALIIFMLFFVLIVIQLVRLDKNYLKKMAQLPLDPENNSQNFTGE